MSVLVPQNELGLKKKKTAQRKFKIVSDRCWQMFGQLAILWLTGYEQETMFSLL